MIQVLESTEQSFQSLCFISRDKLLKMQFVQSLEREKVLKHQMIEHMLRQGRSKDLGYK